MGYDRKSKSDDGIKPSIDIFMILGNILVDKSMEIYETHVRNEQFTSAFSTLMVLRYLSMNSNPNVRKVVLDYLTILENMGEHPELVYKLLLKVVPRTTSKFTPYIKSGFPRMSGVAK